MRRAFTAFAALIALAVLPGCSLFYGSVNCTFANGNKGYANLVLPEYKAYIDADPNLDADSKQTRKDTADKWARLIDDAVQGCKEE